MIDFHEHPAALVARALAHRTEEIALALLGEPSFATPRGWRWGRRGSLWLSRVGETRGRWYDHERGKGGDLLDLLARERNLTLKEAILAALELGGGIGRVGAHQTRSTEALRKGNEGRIQYALRLWREASPLHGSLGERYFVEHRKLEVYKLPLDHVLRWHKHLSAIVALMPDPSTGKSVGLHRTFLNSSGAKIERKMVGRQGVVRLSLDDGATYGVGITEGIEDGLAVLLSGWSPVWAATSAGAVARFPVLSGVEALTIFADADEPGLEAARACCVRWRDAGREVSIASPRVA
jgi:putative DNA primase/helicase